MSKGHTIRLRVHLNCRSSAKHGRQSDITPQTVQDYRVHRMTKSQKIKDRDEREADGTEEGQGRGARVQVQQTL